MAYDASQFINERYIEMPTNRQVGEQTVWRVFSQLVSYASSDAGLVWVSDRTQAEKTGIPRRSVRSARLLLLEAGLMLDTGTVKQKGVKVFQMQIPHYEFAGIPPTEQFASGQGTGRGSGRDSGQGTGRGSGQGTGRGSGKADLPQTELEKNININEHTQNSNKNNLSQFELDNAGNFNLVDTTTPEQYADEEQRQRAQQDREKLERETEEAKKFAMKQLQQMLSNRFTDKYEEPF